MSNPAERNWWEVGESFTDGREAPCFTTRPTTSFGTSVQAAAVAEAMRDARSLRRQAYRQRHRCGCCECVLRYWPLRKTAGLICWLLGIVTTLVRLVLFVLLSPLLLLGRAVLQPSFWLGAFGTLGLVACFGFWACREQSMDQALYSPSSVVQVSVICTTNHPLASDAREALQRLFAIAIEWQVFLQHWADELQRAAAYVVFVITGSQCPFRDADDALASCHEQREVRLIREAPDCPTLRRAHHDAQRQFHPDHLRVRFPKCGNEVLEACSVALNLFVENRRTALECSGR